MSQTVEGYAIERRSLFCVLVAGKHSVESRRTVPFAPRLYLPEAPFSGENGELTDSQLTELVALGILVGNAKDALWDVIDYEHASPMTLEIEVRKYFPAGFGQCRECRMWPLSARFSGNAPRHGGEKKHGIPPCSGSGQPLVNLTLYSSPDGA